MKPFEYKAPKSLDEAVAILAAANGEARVLAGGTDLIAQMKEYRRAPRLVVDGKGIPELTRLEYDDRTGLRIGAAVAAVDIYSHPAVKARYPDIAYACSLLGAVQIQNRATLGGNVGNAAPSADGVPPLLCALARAVIAGPKGRREIPLAQVFLGPGQTSLERGELLVEIVVPPPPPRSAGAYLRFVPREEMDIAVAGVGSRVVMAEDGKTCREARIALCAVAPTPIRTPEAERFLVGRILDDAALAEAGRLAAAAARPISDVRGSADYRRELVKVLTRRTLAQCRAQLGSGSP